MDEDKLLFFKGLLESKLHELIREAEKVCIDMRKDQNDDFSDPADRASLESDRNFLLRIKDRERKLILKVKEALDRIDNGTFGICESCGKQIAEKRLIARPITTLCIDCKKEGELRERLERLRGVKNRGSFPY